MTEERTGEAFEFGEKLTVVGRKLIVGDAAPEFTLDQWGGEAIKSVKLSDTAGEVRLLNVINSVDTPVCHIETQRWDKLRTGLLSGAVLYTVSMDLPFAQGRWGTGEGVGHALLSSHRDTRFAEDYGVLLKEWRLLQRSVFVIDGAGFLTYVEYVADQMMEPDYDAAVAAVRAAV